MLNNKKIIIVLPAYNASLTLEKTYREIPFDVVDDVILVDDASTDDTMEVGKRLGIRHIYSATIKIRVMGATKKPVILRHWSLAVILSLCSTRTTNIPLN